jgi:hypothetical protein
LLAAIYGWFTEEFDTVDLQEAKALLEALERNKPRSIVKIFGSETEASENQRTHLARGYH